MSLPASCYRQGGSQRVCFNCLIRHLLIKENMLLSTVPYPLSAYVKLVQPTLDYLKSINCTCFSSRGFKRDDFDVLLYMLSNV